MEQAGIKTILWSDGIAIEERVASDLPWAGLLEVLALAVEMHGENKIRAAVISKHGASLTCWRLRATGPKQRLSVPQSEQRQRLGTGSKPSIAVSG
jgi:hypothetical protein